MKTAQDIEPFASLLEQEQKTEFVSIYPGPCLEERMKRACTVTVKIGKKFARVDVGDSGKYMVDMETGEIFGVKAYGVVHKGHRFGSLDTIQEWNWRPYRAQPLAQTFATAAIN